MSRVNHTIFPLGDSALVVEFGPLIHEEVNRKVHQLFRRLQEKGFSWLRDLVPAYSSLTLHYHIPSLLRQEGNGLTAYENAAAVVNRVMAEDTEEAEAPGRAIGIPVCYAPAFAPDLEEVARTAGLCNEEVVRLHTERTYTVYMLGFLPGFAYMGSVDERIATPRKAQPRTALEPGSVGIAGEQTGIYPLRSPGGWQIIGRTPLKIFDRERAEPVLLQPGDRITFYPIPEHEFNRY